MLFDPDNKIVKLCAEGMMLEGAGKKEEAAALFGQAWNEASNDFEKFTAAHYVARHQATIAGKLKWDQTALGFALKLDDTQLKGTYPSLYLNIAKCYEDLADYENAEKNYREAGSYTAFLEDDGYGKMIRAGIVAGLERVSKHIGK